MEPILLFFAFACAVICWAYISDKNKHQKIIDKQHLLNTEIFGLKQKIESYENSVSEYRNKYIANTQAYGDVHEHLQKITDQMMILRKNQRIMRDNMIRRYEVLLPDDFRKDIKKLAKQAENF